MSTASTGFEKKDYWFKAHLQVGSSCAVNLPYSSHTTPIRLRSFLGALGEQCGRLWLLLTGSPPMTQKKPLLLRLDYKEGSDPLRTWWHQNITVLAVGSPDAAFENDQDPVWLSGRSGPMRIYDNDNDNLDNNSGEHQQQRPLPQTQPQRRQ